MGFFPRKPKQRTCVVGLDGVPFSLVQRFIRDGVMPNLADIVAKGGLHRMRVTLPEISMVSWTSFMTGTGPGEHGIFGFTDLEPGTYRLRFPIFPDVEIPTMWEEMGERGKRCVVINQPATYPARRINGVMISGFVAIELIRAVFPPIHAARLRKIGYELDIDTMAARKDPDVLFRQLGETLAGRRLAIDLFWDDIDWDFFQVVVTGTDRVFHYQWNALDDESNPNRERFLDYFRKVDRFIGRLYERFEPVSGRKHPEEGFFLLSDHGFTAVRQEVYLNAWLRENGYLSYSTDAPTSLEDLGAGTKAFVMDPGRVYINRKDRYPRGCVAPGEVEGLKREIADGLRGLRFEGDPVIAAVHPAGEIYRGPKVESGPDLVAVSNYGYDLKGSVKEPKVFNRTDLEGMHTWDDAFFWSAGETPPNVKITDLRSIITRAVGE
jgi:predicted AlkP superfamily phosphohydrolase/phosphomutase